MGKRKTFYRRIFMTVLFFSAVIATISYISNVKVQELPHFFFQYLQSEQSTEKDVAEAPIKGRTHYFKEPPEYGSWNSNGVRQEAAESLFQSEGPTEIVMATGYTAGYESTGKTEHDPAYGITYSGVEVRRDFVSTIAADPKYFPIGTILYIPGYGYGVVADTGSAIKGKKLDLYYETVEDVYEEWGKRNVTVHVIKAGDGTLEEEDVMALNEKGILPVMKQEPPTL